MQNLEEEIKKIKEKRSKMEMSEEGKEKIRKIIEDRNTSSENEIIKYVPKKNKTYIFAQKIAAVFICCLVLSSCAFSGEWKDILTKIFYGQGANIEYAVDNGYVQNIDMDYVESNGIKIKADYFYMDDYYMYIALDVVAEEEFDRILLDKFELLDEENNIIFSNSQLFKDIFFQSETKRILKNKAIIFGKFSKMQNKFYNYDYLKININKIQLVNNDTSKYIQGNWDLVTKITNSVFQEQKYYIDSKNLIESCEISYKNFVLNIKIKFKEECIEKFDANRNDVYIQDNSGRTYNINGISKFENDKIIANFFVDEDSNTENLKLNIKYNDEIIVFYLKEIGS